MNNNKKSSSFKLYKYKYASQLIKFWILKYYFINVDLFAYAWSPPYCK